MPAIAIQRPAVPATGHPASTAAAASRAPPSKRTATTGLGRRCGVKDRLPGRLERSAHLVGARRTADGLRAHGVQLVARVPPHHAVVPAVREIDDEAEGEPDD